MGACVKEQRVLERGAGGRLCVFLFLLRGPFLGTRHVFGGGHNVELHASCIPSPTSEFLVFTVIPAAAQVELRPRLAYHYGTMNWSSIILDFVVFGVQ